MWKILGLLFIFLSGLCFNSLLPGYTAGDNLMMRPDLQRHFEGFSGAFVLYDEKNNQYAVFNPAQSNERLTPCSTFKIYHSLIALESGAVKGSDRDTLIPWNGIRYPMDSWNKDQTLSSAIANSVVWYYQELASRIGVSRMQQYIDRLDYGNKDLSGGITRFWLQSSLKISAKEQVDLLRKLFGYQLPFARENIDVVRNMVLLSQDDGVKLYGKTGSGYRDGKYTLGWFVGCVERDGNRYYFAANITGKNGAHGLRAKDITQDILLEWGIL